MGDQVWMIYSYVFMGYNDAGDPDYHRVPEDILYHTEEEAVKALRKKRVTTKHPQWDLMVGYMDEYDRFEYDKRVLVKDCTGVYED